LSIRDDIDLSTGVLQPGRSRPGASGTGADLLGTAATSRPLVRDREEGEAAEDENPRLEKLIVFLNQLPVSKVLQLLRG
jgi:hypothetical protein